MLLGNGDTQAVATSAEGNLAQERDIKKARKAQGNSVTTFETRTDHPG